MARARVSTTVDEQLLRRARRVCKGKPDSVVIDAALEAPPSGHRAGEIDSTYAAYDEHPLDGPDEWGDLGSFRAAT